MWDIIEWRKMVMLGGRKLKEYRVWSANRGKVVCKEYKFSRLFTENICYHILIFIQYIGFYYI